MHFSELGLSPVTLKAITAKGYTEPTPIQQKAIPLVLTGRDVIGSAQTGTGKTAAFALPILSKLGTQPGQHPRVLVLEPTRELAAQVEAAFVEFSRGTNLRTGVIFGGVGYGNQHSMLRRGVDILVATPGRLLDHIGQGTVRLDGVKHLVLDEADHMLDMGFLPDVRRIIERCPMDRQTCLFSATIPADIGKLIKWAMRSPEVIDVGERRTPAETVKHAFYPVAEEQKRDLLVALLDKANFESVIVFCRTKHRTDRLADVLKKTRHKVAVLHSNRSQRQREQALNGFRDGEYDVLVATDIAARGIDVQQVSHVINFDIPGLPEDYVHRIGRTGRAQATGDAFTLIVEEDRQDTRDIERFIGAPIPREKLEGFPYQPSTIFDPTLPCLPGKPKQQRGGRGGGGGQNQRRPQGGGGGGGQGERRFGGRGPVRQVGPGGKQAHVGEGGHSQFRSGKRHK